MSTHCKTAASFEARYAHHHLTEELSRALHFCATAKALARYWYQETRTTQDPKAAQLYLKYGQESRKNASDWLKIAQRLELTIALLSEEGQSQ